MAQCVRTVQLCTDVGVRDSMEIAWARLLPKVVVRCSSPFLCGPLGPGSSDVVPQMLLGFVFCFLFCFRFFLLDLLLVIRQRIHAPLCPGLGRPGAGARARVDSIGSRGLCEKLLFLWGVRE